MPFPPPGDLSDPGIEPASPVSPALQADSLLLDPLGKPIVVIFFSLKIIFKCGKNVRKVRGVGSWEQDG